jgi:hypothetical protein
MMATPSELVSCKSRSLLPLHMCNRMMESRTPRTAIFDPLLVCLEIVQDAKEADVPFVFVRLLPSEVVGVAAIIAAISSLWN